MRDHLERQLSQIQLNGHHLSTVNGQDLRILGCPAVDRYISISSPAHNSIPAPSFVRPPTHQIGTFNSTSGLLS